MPDRMGALESRLPHVKREEHGLGHVQDPAATARSLAFLYASGATLALVSLLLPHSPRTDETGILVTLATAYAIAAALRLGSARTPRWIVHATLVSGTEETGRTERQDEANVATVLALAQALDIRDAGTARHSEVVGRHAAAIAVALGLPAAQVERVRLAGLVHDVGKIGVGDTILRKPGPLDDEEWAEMHKHPEIGARILGGKGLDDVSAWVLAHHERPDGLGYPYGLRDEQIPVEAKIVAVADAYEAMTASRVYRQALSHQEAAAELRRGAGHQFDARAVHAFLGVLAPVGAGV